MCAIDVDIGEDIEAWVKLKVCKIHIQKDINIDIGARYWYKFRDIWKTIEVDIGKDIHWALSLGSFYGSSS